MAGIVDYFRRSLPNCWLFAYEPPCSPHSRLWEATARGTWYGPLIDWHTGTSVNSYSKTITQQYYRSKIKWRGANADENTVRLACATIPIVRYRTMRNPYTWERHQLMVTIVIWYNQLTDIRSTYNVTTGWSRQNGRSATELALNESMSCSEWAERSCVIGSCIQLRRKNFHQNRSHNLLGQSFMWSKIATLSILNATRTLTRKHCLVRVYLLNRTCSA